jgi:glycosyltransferase involved in cell wall biosynthesis
MDDKIKILYVNRSMQSPPHIGGQQRMFNIGRQLKKCGPVTLLCVNHELDPNALELAQQEFEQVELMKLRRLQTPCPMLHEIRHKVQMHWPTNPGDHVCRKDVLHFTKLLREHDVVWFSTLPAANSFGTRRFARSIMDLDDLMHVKFALRTKIDATLRWRLSARVQSFKWRRQEYDSFRRFTSVVLCSREDKQILGDHPRIRIVPNGFPVPQKRPDWKHSEDCYLGFIGTLSYGPNAEGIEWFRDQVWPLITKEVPQAKLRLVGKIPEPRAFLDAPGFEPLGFVEDPTEEFSRWQAMIVPLRYGGGTRLKILEAFSRMCPVISTPVGAYGLEVIHQHNILLEDDPQAFARQCIQLLQQPNLGKPIAEAGWDLFTEKYTWDVIGNSIQNAVRDCVDRSRKRAFS